MRPNHKKKRYEIESLIIIKNISNLPKVIQSLIISYVPKKKRKRIPNSLSLFLTLLVFIKPVRSSRDWITPFYESTQTNSCVTTYVVHDT